ncbi:hypothetical protein Syn7502_01852 [Synechococcus sp. PCC 7502]|uniref:hypothetical protein n=1 Tax=Synechococcus sp. PCC 7502 TaxID=1173263 RepID=UPI00029FC806|nr:hypothetical protein [Synechococcus sp. PCC 7502]AFY73886.1 hypothetical protein Syn7502_01852 [Synechococcus sp. PCC 7502]
MSNPVKEKISSNLDKAKKKGKIRTENIQEIVKDAVSQTVVELKEGADEIRTIIKDAIFTVITDLKGSKQENTEIITASIQGAIAGSTSARQQELAQQRAKLAELQTLLDQRQQNLDLEISEVLLDIKAISPDSSDINSEAISMAVKTVQDRQESQTFQEQYFNLQSQLTNLDQKLEAHYGDRYSEVKQQWQHAKAWYSQKVSEAEAIENTPLQEKNSEIESNLGDFGAIVARKEKEIKEKVQKIWGNKGFGSKY